MKLKRTLNLLTSKDLSAIYKDVSLNTGRIVAQALKNAMEGNLLASAGITAVIDFKQLDNDILYVSKLKYEEGAYAYPAYMLQNSLVLSLRNGK